jgi:anti-anti-sigma factor
VADDYFTIALEPAGGSATSRVLLAGAFDIGTREDLRKALLDLIGGDPGSRITVDLRRVTFIDSEAINALIEGFLTAERAGVTFRLAGARGIVDRVLRVVGLDHLLDPPENGGDPEQV